MGGLLGILALGGGFLAMKGKGEEAPAAATAAVVAPASVPAVAPAPAAEPAGAVDAGTHALEAEKAEQDPVAVAPSAPAKRGRASGGFAPAPEAAPAAVPAPAPAPKPAAKPSSVGDDLGF